MVVNRKRNDANDRSSQHLNEKNKWMGQVRLHLIHIFHVNIEARHISSIP